MASSCVGSTYTVEKLKYKEYVPKSHILLLTKSEKWIQRKIHSVVPVCSHVLVREII